MAVRHGLTLGEIVSLCAMEGGVDRRQLEVVAIQGVDRRIQAPDWDRPFVPPSPNMPTFDTALVYPGGCLVEGTLLSEARGTTRPFELFGAPWLQGERLRDDLTAACAKLGLKGFRARSVSFAPTFHKFAGSVCHGVHVHVTERHAFQPYATYLALLALAHAQSPDSFEFRTEPYEFRDDVPALDLLTGGSAVREAIASSRPPEQWVLELARVRAPDRDRWARGREALAHYAV
jgi:uncharacterized protein YbbC (DUF1343 family)